MLQKIRDRSSGLVAGILLFVIALAFAVWGIDFNFAGSNFVAKVNGEEIPVAQARRAFQAQLARFQEFYAGGIPPAIEGQIRASVVDNFVREELLAQRTEADGYRVGDEQLRDAIRAMEAFHIDGRFDKNAYQRLLGAQGMSTTMFEAQMRRSLATTQLQDAVARTGFVTGAELQRRAALENQTREIAYITFPAAEYGEEAQPDEAEIAMYYESNLNNFVTEETVDIEYIELNQENLVEEVDEDTLRSYYDGEVKAGRFQAPPERKARHILLAVGADDEAGQQELSDQLLERIRAGEDFAALATEFSDDPGSASEGGALDWAERNAFVGAFRDALFDMVIDEVRGPIRTGFGFHIIRLEGIRGGEPKPFDEVRAELLAEIQQRGAEERFYEIANDLEEIVFEQPDTLEIAAQAHGLERQTLSGVARDNGTGIAVNAAVRDAAFSDQVLVDRENSNPIQVQEGQIVFLRVSSHTPSREQTLEEVRSRVETALRNETSREKAREFGAVVESALRAGGDISTAGDDYKGVFHAAAVVGRSGSQGVPPAIVSAAFAAPRPAGGEVSVGGTDLPNGDYAVFVVSAVTDGEAQDDSQAANASATQSGQKDFQAYLAALREDARVIVQPDQLQ